MSAEKQTAKSATEASAVFGPAAFTAGLEIWKSQPTVIAAYFGDLLKGAEKQTRRQADFLGQLSRCKDLPEVLSAQTGFVTESWTGAVQQLQESIVAARKASLPTAEA